MRKTLAVLGLFLATATASAQQGLGQNKTQINGGVGFSGWGLPVYVGLDYGIARDVTIGGEVSYVFNTDNVSIFGFGVNGNYYFDRLLKLPREFDVYAGATLSYFNIGTSGPASSGVNLGLQVGGRYFFTKNLGLNLQLGGGTATFGGRLGLTYKFD